MLGLEDLAQSLRASVGSSCWSAGPGFATLVVKKTEVGRHSVSNESLIILAERVARNSREWLPSSYFLESGMETSGHW